MVCCSRTGGTYPTTWFVAVSLAEEQCPRDFHCHYVTICDTQCKSETFCSRSTAPPSPASRMRRRLFNLPPPHSYFLSLTQLRDLLLGPPGLILVRKARASAVHQRPRRLGLELGFFARVRGQQQPACAVQRHAQRPRYDRGETCRLGDFLCLCYCLPEVH